MIKEEIKYFLDDDKASEDNTSEGDTGSGSGSEGDNESTPQEPAA